ncbi:MAG: amino acid ABC transporter substrate-binding protein [Burkholderiales bacterium]|nr:amino acid ABC transporter substrate-binding protein [Burkholderiales bacterium]
MKKRILLVLALGLFHALPALAQAGVLERIRASGAITLGYLDGAAPFSFVGEKREPQGYSVALCREIAAGIREQLKLAKLDTRWVQLTIQNRLEAVRTGRVDIECSTTTWTLSRQAVVDFSLITFVDGGSILARKAAGAARLADFGGKRVAVITGTTTERVLREGLAQRRIKAEVVTVRDRPEGLKLLEAGKVDGFASDRTTLIALAAGSKAGADLRLLDEDFSVEPYAFALPRGDADFRLAVNRALARVYRTGGIQAVYDRWLGELGPPSLLLSAMYFMQSLAE